MNDGSIEGISLMSAALGFIGASLGIGYMPPMSKKQMFSALLAGVMCAALIAPLAAQWAGAQFDFVMPKGGHYLLGFFFGIGGMFIIPGVIVFWRTASTNPMAIVEWVRGRAPPPAPPSPPPPPPSPPPGGAP